MLNLDSYSTHSQADELIKIVGIETEKVTKEKASADEEKIKVDQINVEVSIKQTDCAADLKKAEPALIAAEQALNTLNKVAEKKVDKCS